MKLDNNLNGIFKGAVFRSKRRKAAEEAMLLRELRDKAVPEKGDLPALIIAGMITIIPVALVILFLYYAITMWIFG